MSSGEQDGATGVARRIEADIMLGALTPGAWLRLVEMEARYGASRFEVRAALASLTAVKVLEHVPNRGYRVIIVTEEEVRQRVAVRLMLEIPAANLVVRHARDTDLPWLRELAARFEWCIEHATTPELDMANHAFHRAYFSLCGNPHLEQLVNELRERTRPSGWKHWKTVSRNRDSAADHFAMVDAVAARDEARLRQVVWRHIHRPGPDPLDGEVLATAFLLPEHAAARP